MGNRSEEAVGDAFDDAFEPLIGEFSDEAYEGTGKQPTDRQRLAEKRRRAEKRLEELRLREELGDYDLEFDDF